MTAVPGVDRIAPYRPRRFESLGAFQQERWHLKLYGIHHDVQRPPGDVIHRRILDAVTGKIPAWLGEADRLGHHHHSGFVIIHHGLDAIWALVHWWTHGDICCHLLLRADLTNWDEFDRVGTPEMACVWELAVIDFERRAWVDTVLSARGGLEQYRALRLADGQY